MRKPRPIHAVLFDATGTLIELRQSVGETYSRVARDYGVTLTARSIDDAFGRALKRAPSLAYVDLKPAEIERRERDWWRDVVRSTFDTADSSGRISDFEGLFDVLYRLFSEVDSWRCRPGGVEVLRALRARGLATGIVSNFDRRLRPLLGDLQLAPLLDTVVLPSDAGAEKPDPRIFQFALESLGAAASASVFVGDSEEYDIAGARAAGMHAIHVESLATLCDLPEHLSELAIQPELR